MKSRIVIPIHSILDVITNSSTELFIIDGAKGVETVKEAVLVALIKHPAVYDGYGGPNVYVGDPTYYDYGGFYSLKQFGDDDIIKYMEMRGYKITKPEEVTEPEAIIVEWERGTMSQGFIDEISTLFETELTDH